MFPSFHKVFGVTAKQGEIYDTMARPVVEGVFAGYNGAILAYGQTGTGKTHCITGGPGGSKGIIPRAFQQMFQLIEHGKIANPSREYLVGLSTMEIYNELCYDLLSRTDAPGHEGFTKVGLLEDAAGNVRLRNLAEHPVHSLESVEKLLRTGMSNRSERVWRSNSTGPLLYEARHINLSLHYLEQVILALSDPCRSHVPYRNSMITTFLRDSLGGNSCTAMVFTLSLEPSNFKETLSTCRFAQRVSQVKNSRLKVYEIDRDEELAFLRLEVDRLRKIIDDMEAPKETDLNSPPAPDHCQIIEQNGQNEYEDDFEPCSTSSNKSVAKDQPVTPVTEGKAQIETVQNKPLKRVPAAPPSDDFKITVNHINRGIHLLSTLLKEASMTLCSEEASEVVNAKKVSSVLGLDLPPNINSAGFSGDQKKAFEEFLSLPESNEAIRRYAQMNVAYYKQLEAEWNLWKRLSSLIGKIDSLDLSIKEASENGEFPEVLEDMQKNHSQSMLKYEKYRARLQTLKKERSEFLGIFTKARQALFQSFINWWEVRTRAGIQIRKSDRAAVKKDVDRLNKWAMSLRSRTSSEENLNSSDTDKQQTDKSPIHSIFNTVHKAVSSDHLNQLKVRSEASTKSIERLNIWASSLRKGENSLQGTFSSGSAENIHLSDSVRSCQEDWLTRKTAEQAIVEKPTCPTSRTILNEVIGGIYVKLTGDPEVDEEIRRFYECKSNETFPRIY